MRLTKFIPLLAAAFGSFSDAADFGRFGTTLDQAKATSFFNWFHLEQTSAEGDVRCFQPSGPKFHDKVKLLVKTNSAGIQSMTLMLQRGFINGGESPFARDIAKSFIDTGLSGPDLDRVRDLYNEISSPPRGSQIIMHADAPRPKLPASPTAGYQAFLGDRPSWNQKLRGASFALENQGDWLAMSIIP